MRCDNLQVLKSRTPQTGTVYDHGVVRNRQKKDWGSVEYSSLSLARGRHLSVDFTISGSDAKTLVTAQFQAAGKGRCPALGR